jgi:hypothetical protein
VNKLFLHLSPENFLHYAIKNYDNPSCEDTEEFYEDLKRIKYIKKLLKRYLVTGELKDRLIINHLVIMSNVFGIVPTLRMIFYKCKDEEYRILLKTFFTFLRHISEYNARVLIKLDYININIIPVDNKLLDQLQNV